jgi:hypothetical protein
MTARVVISSCTVMSASGGDAGVTGTTAVCTGGCWIAFRFTVDATAANPHRAGEMAASSSIPVLPASRKIPPVRMIWNITTTTSSGMVLSVLLTSAEMNRPSVIETIASTPRASSSSISGRCGR